MPRDLARRTARRFFPQAVNTLDRTVNGTGHSSYVTPSTDKADRAAEQYDAIEGAELSGLPQLTDAEKQHRLDVIARQKNHAEVATANADLALTGKKLVGKLLDAYREDLKNAAKYQASKTEHQNLRGARYETDAASIKADAKGVKVDIERSRLNEQYAELRGQEAAEQDTNHRVNTAIQAISLKRQARTAEFALLQQQAQDRIASLWDGDRPPVTRD